MGSPSTTFRVELPEVPADFTPSHGGHTTAKSNATVSKLEQLIWSFNSLAIIVRVEGVVWFSNLLRASVTLGGREIGKTNDLVLRLEESTTPTVTGALVYNDDVLTFIPFDKVSTVDEEVISSNQPEDQFLPFERRAGEILVKRDLLKHHMIWSRPHHRPRLVTSRDVGITYDGRWHAACVDVAARARVLRIFQSKSEESRQAVSWTELLPLVGHVPTARRRLELKSIREMHPAQLADLLEQASYDEGREIFDALQHDPELEADVVEEMEPERRRDALRNRSDEELGELLGSMEPDNAVDLLLDLDQDQRENVLALIPMPEQDAVKALLTYHPETAGGFMTTEFISVSHSATVDEICAQLRALSDELANLWTIFIVDEDRKLVGQLPVARLITAQPQQLVTAILSEGDPPRVSPDAELSEIAITMADYNLVSLAVVDTSDRLLGIITIDDVLPRTLSSSWRRRREALEVD